ncbi:zinc finger protein 260-like isoform X2 [Maniola jurtina]|uniref:zinc finger protein 260-like isoform X2 n=1 Tax=Maniola jurtina TaxID=191418 RepID=UPI001E68A3AF|nr:zinc finger protein 260-like isoform X2 [Maniola jurtina]
MQCCVPFCKNTSDNVSSSHGEGKAISFHGFPSEVHLRAEWLRALGKQDTQPPDSAVVCSQHFLNDDIYETESGVRQISTGAIPVTVQVCMICLDTDSKLFLLSQLKLEGAYEKLTGHALCAQGNLKQTLCIQCAQRLISFSRFRDKSLRARALMMDLVDKHELITRQHIQMINRTKLQLKSDLVLTTLGPDHCDLHILEHPSEDKQTELEETGLRVAVKAEGSGDDEETMCVDEDMAMKSEDDRDIQGFVRDPLEYEGCPLQCTLCLEEFVHEHAYMQHVSMHLWSGEAEAEGEAEGQCGTSQREAHSWRVAESRRACARAASDERSEPATAEADTGHSCGHRGLTDCFVKLYDIFPRRDGSPTMTQEAVTHISHRAASPNGGPTTEYAVPGEEKLTVSQPAYICDSCQRVFKRKSLLAKHVQTHAPLNTFTCKICQYEANDTNHLIVHMRTHTGDQPFSCELCKYECNGNSDLVKHMRTHTGEKPYRCKLCAYKCNRSNDLARHMRTHTGEKPFCCKLCNYKSSQKSPLVVHIRTHTGEKPFSCEICKYKCNRNSDLVQHMRTHTGEKPFCCELCKSKFISKRNLVLHMRTHTAEKPFCCELCKSKFISKRNLVLHMRTHTGEKPYCCELCNYKSSQKRRLVVHMRTHTGEK